LQLPTSTALLVVRFSSELGFSKPSLSLLPSLDCKLPTSSFCIWFISLSVSTTMLTNLGKADRG
jgi:hypothetical protein